MMRGLVAPLEQHHNVRILDEAVEAAVSLSHRYIAGRQLPDKAVGVLDTACARVALGIHLRGAGDILPDLRVPAARFAEVLVENAGFALEVQSRIPEEVLLPDLIARVDRLTVSSGAFGERLTMQVTVRNIGTTQTENETAVAVFLSADNVLDRGDTWLGSLPVGTLGPGGEHSAVFRVSELSAINGRFVLLSVDPMDRVAESDEDNNLQWERMRLP